MDIDDLIYVMAKQLDQYGTAADMEIVSCLTELKELRAKLAAMESQEPALRINSMGGAMQWNPNYKGDWSGVFYAKPMPADKPAVAVPVFSESDLIEIASSYSAYAGSDTDLYLNAWINSGEAKGFIDLINDRSAPSHSQQSDALPVLIASHLDEAVDVLAELMDLMQGVIDGDYKPDSFTLQPARVFMHKIKFGDHFPNHESEQPNISADGYEDETMMIDGEDNE